MMRSRTVLAAACLTVTVAAGCGSGDDATSGVSGDSEAATAPDPTAEHEAEAAPEQAHWSYEGETGPDNWAQLDAAYATCGAGQEQSPVALSPDIATPGAEVPPLTYDYSPATYELVNNGHTIQASAQDAGGLTIGDERYDLLQFHVHTPSEHTLDGEQADLGVHLVHQNEQDELAVLGLFIEGGAGDSALAEAWAELPVEEGDTGTLDDFDVSSLLPEDRSTYRYDGSLTTPPCTEGVRWLLMREPVEAPSEFVSEVRDLLSITARPLQDLNGRQVLLSQE